MVCLLCGIGVNVNATIAYLYCIKDSHWFFFESALYISDARKGQSEYIV